MPVTIHPKIGQILMCDFGTGFRAPEMVKKRPVVVIGCRHNGLCTVVPLSTKTPEPVEDCHLRLPPEHLPQIGWFEGKVNWVKADMIYTVGLDRLDLIRLGTRKNGKREYFKTRLRRETMAKIYACVLSGIGLGELAKYLRA